MENIVSEKKVIDFTKIWKIMWKKKKTYFIVLPIAFIIACIIALSIPRYYTCLVKLAPELTSTSMSNLNSLASSFGVDIANKIGQNQDAISPGLYPDLIDSKDFRTSLFPIKIQTKDGSIKTNYYTYLHDNQKVTWWSYILDGIANIFTKEEPSIPYDGNERLNSFNLTKEQYFIVSAIGQKIKCSVDKKTNIISIVVTDQDPLVCATIADSVSVRLQKFITDYRTNKARIDLEYTQNLFNEAKKQYDSARQRYGSFSDSNSDLMLNSYRLKAEDMENEMQLKFNAYTALSAQLQSARAKLQERTPAFTTLQSASVPVLPAGPKRTLLVTIILILTFFVTTVHILLKE